MIKDIEILKIDTHKDHRGFFREISRLNNLKINFSEGQISHSLVNKDVLKAWHGHKAQTQINYLINGKIKVVLYDYRKNSDTFNEYHEFLVDNNENAVVYLFKPGILHSYKCLEGPMNIIYFTSGTYNISEEVRISTEDSSIKYKW